jgi:hypothetical protein
VQLLVRRSRNDVHVLLVARQGDILWRTIGSFDPAKGRELAKAIETYLGALKCPNE